MSQSHHKTQSQHCDDLNHLQIHGLAQTSWEQMVFLFARHEFEGNSMLSSGTLIFQLIVERPLEKSQCYKTKYF